MIAKGEILAFVSESEPATSADVAMGLAYVTRTGAAATLLRLYRQGHLRRERHGARYLYVLSDKGRMWLSLFG